jgi:hypothetical protein
LPTQTTVFDPSGFPPKVVGKQLCPSLETLNGKTVFLVDGRFHDHVLPFFEQMQDWFAANLPKVKTEIVRWREPFADDPEVSRLIAERGDAAIMGVGT